jgi:hypothetical protein
MMILVGGYQGAWVGWSEMWGRPSPKGGKINILSENKNHLHSANFEAVNQMDGNPINVFFFSP